MLKTGAARQLCPWLLGPARRATVLGRPDCSGTARPHIAGSKSGAAFSRARPVRQGACRSRVTMATSKDLRVIQLKPQLATSESFQQFGQLMGPVSDGKQYDQEDAQLQLDKGTPRFYIMRLPKTGLAFDRITYHANVTQCLSAVQDQPWFLAVGAPSGSVQQPPTKDTLQVFQIPHGHFVKLHAGSWHAGPLFAGPEHMDFYNLELSDTNVVDHNTHVYHKDNIKFEVSSV